MPWKYYRKKTPGLRIRKFWVKTCWDGGRKKGRRRKGTLHFAADFEGDLDGVGC